MGINKKPPKILKGLPTTSRSDGGKHKTTCNAIHENLRMIIPNLHPPQNNWLRKIIPSTENYGKK